MKFPDRARTYDSQMMKSHSASVLVSSVGAEAAGNRLCKPLRAKTIASNTLLIQDIIHSHNSFKKGTFQIFKNFTIKNAIDYFWDSSQAFKYGLEMSKLLDYLTFL